MLFYLLKNKETGKFLKGTGKNYADKIPPKLYSLGTAKATQTSYRSGRRSAYYEPEKPVELEIVPVYVVPVEQAKQTADLVKWMEEQDRI